MHKIRNKEHLALIEKLKSMYPELSKRVIREILRVKKWDEHEAIQWIKSGDYFYHFIDD